MILSRQHHAIVTGTIFSSTLVLLMLLTGPHGTSGSTSPNPNSVNPSFVEVMGRFGLLSAIKPNPYVAAAPLIIAAECSDGLVMIAAHTVSKEEKLLRAFDDEGQQDEGTADGNGESENSVDTTSPRQRWNDFQYGLAGPSRIRRIDRFGTHLLSAGWRPDCDLLGDKLCSIASREVALFGKPRWGLPYGRHLAEEATYFLAKFGASGVRLPSCIGLLAACGNNNGHNNDNDGGEDGRVGSLWMIDVNGWYRVKSLAVGGGPAPENDKNCTVVAQLVNDKLQEFDSRELTAEETMARILTILGADGDEEKDGRTPLLSQECELEIACTEPNSRGRISRRSLSSLWEASVGAKEDGALSC